MGLLDLFRRKDDDPATAVGMAAALRAAPEMMASRPRSPKWKDVRAQYLKEYPTCQGCGSTRDLNVHHKEPYHLFPEKELDSFNLITLCEGPTNCHYLLGHCGISWSAYNPYVASHAYRYWQLLSLIRTTSVGA